MQVIILADELQRAELLNGNSVENIVWIKDKQDFLQYKEADAFIDLEFVNDEKRKALLGQLLPKLVIINSVTDTLEEVNTSFVRINAWKTFLSSSLLEAVCIDEAVKEKAEEVFAGF